MRSMWLLVMAFASWGFSAHATKTVNGTGAGDLIFIGDLLHYNGVGYVHLGVYAYQPYYSSLTAVGLANGEELDVNGGDGNDVIEFMNATSPTYVPISGTQDELIVISSLSSYAPVIDGGNGNDYIVGSDEDDYIYGGAGNDTIYGRDGDDHLIGFTKDCSLDSTCVDCEVDDEDTCYGEAGNDGILCDLLADGGNDDGDVCDGDDYGSGCDKENFCVSAP